MKLRYIIVKGEYYYPMDKWIQDPKKIEGAYYPVCYIKPLEGGLFQIDYFNEVYPYERTEHFPDQGNQTPNARIIAYPSGIEKVEYEREG